ncbi:hypothetical protein QF037_010158 [Streptomyces canus]|uniref:hypothetical protein n=1 Tax=Streptomyces canus TaxID=58343 RepID=UPI002780882E|nr:hypothetical protein [Streptomyces canus]MDQ0605725.1 hypothetical protein [Streptomyces canus]
MNAYSDTLVPAQDLWPICDPYAPTALDPDAGRTGVREGGDYLLPPPEPAQRLNIPLGPVDRRRLDLCAALTIRGIAPLPGDQHAVDAISSLGDAVTAAVLHWVAHPTAFAPAPSSA